MRRGGLGALFLVLAVAFAGICVAAARSGHWVIAAPAAALGLWLAGLAAAALRR